MGVTDRARRAAAIVLVGAVVVGLGACSDDDGGGGSGLSRDALSDAGSRCPVDLAAAVEEAGLEVDGEATVEVTDGSGGADPGAAAIDQVGGVFVECRQPLAGEGGDGDGDAGEVASVVFASDQPAAVSLLLPLVQQDLQLTMDQIDDVLLRTEDTDVGELVDLEVDGPGAIARLDIDGAESGVLYVSSSGASADQVRAVAEDLLGPS